MSETSVEQALQEADRCVKCGLCLPHCPTYRLYANENASPRGRIALAEALLKGQLATDSSAVDHLYQCLLCRSCEANCPSGVKYATLLDAARAKAPRSHWTSRLLDNKQIAPLLQQLARSVPLPGSRLSALARALPASQAPEPGRYPARSEPRGTVGLFLGCATSQYQGSALQAALDLLTRLGYAVVIARQQGCCGALAQHQGKRELTEKQIANNQAALKDCDIVTGTASGCVVQLQETLGRNLPVSDIVSFIAEALEETPLPVAPLAATAMLHVPCTAANVLKNTQDHFNLLQNIPNLEVHALAKADKSGDCCGAAGDHVLTHAKQAASLREPLLEQVAKQQPAYLLSSNIGCALHLAEGLHKRGQAVQVMHPVELVAHQVRLHALKE